MSDEIVLCCIWKTDLGLTMQWLEMTGDTPLVHIPIGKLVELFKYMLNLHLIAEQIHCLSDVIVKDTKECNTCQEYKYNTVS